MELPVEQQEPEPEPSSSQSPPLNTLFFSTSRDFLVELPSSTSAVLTLDGLDDVEDYGWENRPEDLASEIFHHVFLLVQNGNMAFQEKRMRQAVTFYSRANYFKSNDPIILGNRSAAYIRMSLFLKHRSPLASENEPLNALDPTRLAALGLKDAEKLVDLKSNSVKSYLLKANALFLLEKYEEARDAILSGLQVDLFSDSLRAALENLERASASSTGISRHGQPERNDDFDCSVCWKLLYEPVTTPCGHSFCRLCLLQSMDHGNKCPMCRTLLFISPGRCFISVTLKNIIQKSFPEEYTERKKEQDSLNNFGKDMLPLLVTLIFVTPCQKFEFDIYRPQDRLMVRRIMEGNRRMGMVINDPTTDSLAEFGCEVEITECDPLANGTLYTEIVSRRRFRIIQTRNQDCYRVAEVEWIQDIMPLEGTREREDLQEVTYNAAEYARSWIRRAKEAVSYDETRFERVLQLEVMKPTLRDPELFSFWLSTLSHPGTEQRLDLLRITDTKERIRRCLRFIGAGERAGEANP